jgi:putative addiction module component (TIGR02574 family)
MTVREILEAALRLEPAERELLVEELSASLHGGFASAGLERAWRDEIGRRNQEIDAGTAELLDWSDVKIRISERERHARRPG